jgi:hypothetical protein
MEVTDEEIVHRTTSVRVLGKQLFKANVWKETSDHSLSLIEEI